MQSVKTKQGYEKFLRTATEQMIIPWWEARDHSAAAEIIQSMTNPFCLVVDSQDIAIWVILGSKGIWFSSDTEVTDWIDEKKK